jgi:hypothetical protein
MSESARGTPMQPELRSGVRPLLYAHTAVSLCEAAWASWATVLFLPSSFSCGADATPEDEEALRTIRSMVLLSLVSLAACALGCLFAFDFFGSVDASHAAELTELWETKCQWMCCLARPHRHGDKGRVALSSVGSIMASLFAGACPRRSLRGARRSSRRCAA